MLFAKDASVLEAKDANVLKKQVIDAVTDEKLTATELFHI